MTQSLENQTDKKGILRNYYIIIVFISFLIYANTLKHGFVLDDVAVIESNKFVKAGVKGIPLEIPPVHT